MNMRQSVLAAFLSSGKHQNINEFADAESGRTGESPDTVLKRLLGLYYERRMAYEGRFTEGRSFRYGALNICHDHVHIVADIVFDVLRQCATLGILRMEETQIAAALPDSDDNFLGFCASVDTPSDFLSADIGFIHLNRAIQFLKRRNLGHRVPDSVAEIPCRAVVDAQHPFKLIGTHTLARLAKQVGCKEPFRERQVRVMEDRASRDGELIAA